MLEKTGLRPDMPPDHVHAMARGPLAAGGSIYYADMLAEALRRVGSSMDDVRRGLDFGCSSGRVVRVLAATAGRRRSGTDATRTATPSPGRGGTCRR